MPEERRLVSVLFVDVVGSTALGHDHDPEVVRAVLARYFERVREIAEDHGGTVEKFIGDAVMVAFGVPRLHDDDAERAVRTALAIRDALEPLNEELALRLEARSGVNTGEVVAALDERAQFLITGDVVNVAARLQQAAEAGEIVVGDLTEQLTRAAIDYERRPPVDARGIPQPIAAFRARRALTEIPEQARGLPSMRARLVGRARELRLLLDSFERARDDERPQLFTIVGTAGVGKSRLVGEFLARIPTGAGDATVLRGRCLPYGTGVTWWPIMETIQSDLGVTSGVSRADALERLDARLAGPFTNDADRAGVRTRLAVLLGLADASDALPDVPGPRLPAELGAGYGRYLEALAASGPTVVVIDDLQWAEPPAIEVLRGVFERALDIPLVIVCIARPELLEANPSWGAGTLNSTVIVLEPLSEEETRTLIARLLDIDGMPEPLRTAIVARAEGNPLFCEEFVRMLIEDGRLVRDGDRWVAADARSFEVRVPESIHALLAARLDALGPDEKRLVAAASVIGEQFEAGQVAALLPATSLDEVTADLARLARRGLVVANRHAGPGAHRFRHLLIRDVAYAALPKAERARLHDAFGLHLEAEAAAGGRREELVEILAYHAERALTLSTELRQTGPQLAARARRAFDLALDAAERAVRREDSRASEAFLAILERAGAALGPGLEAADRAARLLLVGRVEELRPDYDAAEAALREAIAAAESIDRHDLAGQAHLWFARSLVQSMRGEADLASWHEATAAARRHFAAIGDADGQIAAESVELEWLFSVGRLTEMLERGQALAARAESIGVPASAARLYTRLVSTAGWLGRGDIAEALAERAIPMAAELGLGTTVRWARFYRARLYWMRGDLDRTERECRDLIGEADGSGDGTMSLVARRLLAETLLETDRTAEAEAAVRAALEWSVRTGDRWSRTELLAELAEVRLRGGALEEAQALLAEAESTVRAGDVAAQSVLLDIRGLVARAAGDEALAERSFREELALVRTTEYFGWTMAALALAELLVEQGRLAEAEPLIREVDETMRRLGYGLRRKRIDAVLAALGAMPGPVATPQTAGRAPGTSSGI